MDSTPAPATDGPTQHVVVMGVSGSGKSTIAVMIAERLGYTFAEADNFHSPDSVKKMESGIALQDDDRWPWLERLGTWMSGKAHAGESTVITCSALKRSYRDVLREGAHDVDFIHLHGSVDLIRDRMAGRSGHYMPVSLLQSQVDTLEPLGEDEHGIIVDLAKTPEQIVDEAIAWLKKTQS